MKTINGSVRPDTTAIYDGHAGNIGAINGKLSIKSGKLFF